MTLLAATVMCAPGCGKSSSGSTKPDEGVAHWTPAPGLVSQLKQTGEVGDYRLSLPVGFPAIAPPRGLPRNMKMASWKGSPKATALHDLGTL
jgi:hypothetical protein